MGQIIILALDGEAVMLQNPVVNITLRLPDKDMSGQASSTSNAEQGDKAKELRVSGIIAFTHPEHLTRIFQLAEARGGNGARHCYRIANTTAQAVGMRQGVFSGGVDVAEQRDKMAWQITFTLREQLSVPEKTAARSAAGNVSIKQQTAGGSESVPPGSGPNAQNAFFERLNRLMGDGLDVVGIGRADAKESTP